MAKRFSPLIGLAVVVALAMVAVFGAMSLANPAQADIARSPEPSAMVTANGIIEDEEGDPLGTTPTETYEYDDDKYEISNSAKTMDRTYVIEFTVNGAYVPDDAILIELPGVMPTDVFADSELMAVTPRGAPVGTSMDADLSVSSKSGTADYMRFGERGDTVTGLEGDPLLFNFDINARIAADKPQRVRVEIEGLTNSALHGPNTVKIHHFDADGNPDPDDDGPLMATAKVTTQTTTYHINTVKVGEKDGTYTLEFIAQKAYATNDELVITMDGYDLPDSILAQDVEVGSTAARSVTVDTEESTVTVNVPRPGIEKGATVMVMIFDTAGITKPTAKGAHPWVVGEAKSADDDSVMVTAEEVEDLTPRDPGAPGRAALTSDTDDPGENTRYKIVFKTNKAIRSGIEDITIELEDFDVPSSIETDSVSVSLMGDHDNKDDTADRTVTNSPADVTVDGEKIILTLKNQADDFVDTIVTGTEVTIIIRQSAGVSNPSEGGKYGAPKDGEKDEDMLVTIDGADDLLINEIPIDRKVSLDPDDGGRGKEVTATGKGFKNGTTLTFFLDANGDGVRNTGEFDLCSETVGSNDVGTCTFEVTNPPFMSGDNEVNAVDGRSNYASSTETDTFSLDPSLTATPKGGTPGEIILVQLTDFTNTNVTRVRLARRDLCNDASTDVEGCPETVPSTGDLNFRITIPDWAPDGKQDFRVDVGDEDASTTLEITGPVITTTPSTVVANQRVSLVGDGFNDGSIIAEISIGGEVINLARINGGQPVRVDNGGGWSAAVNLPLSSATTSEGTREIRVTDSEGRSGTVDITVPTREVTVDPASGRVGTLATVRGANFPSKNDDGSSFNVDIEYDTGDGETTVSAVPDASGRFEVQMRIPTSADIPSTNTVKVSFDTELADGRDGGPTIVTTVTHTVPEGVITLSTDTGPPGTRVNISGQGFKAYVPVQSVSVGSIEVTPSPAPSTDVNGMMIFDIVIPGLDNGIQTIEVEVSGTTASVGFIVAPSGVAPGAVTASAKAVVNLGDNFVRSFNFNNDTKSWTFYSPEAPDDSTQTNFVTGESYWILIGETQEVILNGKTRNLTCAAGSCWNQIVW